MKFALRRNFVVQKSYENWVKFKDRNIQFFHVQTIVRRRRNRIYVLFIADT